MERFHITEQSCHKLSEASAWQPGTSGFLWLDMHHEEIPADAELWRQQIASLTGIDVFDLHLQDAANLNHPSSFEDTQDYTMLVFRKLLLNAEPVRNPENADTTRRRLPAALQKLQTAPVSFIFTGDVLITVRPAQSRTIESLQQKLLSLTPRSDTPQRIARMPSSPTDLMLRLLNAMVDQYLELRQPLTHQLDRWQQALLNPRRPFNNWMALLEARMEIRRLDNLCEEQHDALQELRDHLVDTYDSFDDHSARAKDWLLVRTNDVMSHVQRVLNHARRLEGTLESAVQMHFSAMAHRTSEIMRVLTVITALFMPLTLITGIFGMNFEHMPLIKTDHGFGYIMAGMAFIVVLLLLVFRRQRYLEDQIRDQI